LESILKLADRLAGGRRAPLPRESADSGRRSLRENLQHIRRQPPALFFSPAAGRQPPFLPLTGPARAQAKIRAGSGPLIRPTPKEDKQVRRAALSHRPQMAARWSTATFAAEPAGAPALGQESPLRDAKSARTDRPAEPRVGLDLEPSFSGFESAETTTIVPRPGGSRRKPRP